MIKFSSELIIRIRALLISSFLRPVHTCSVPVSTFLSLFFSSRHFLLSSKHRRQHHQCQPPAPAQAAPGPPLLAAVCAADPRLAPEPRGPGGWRCINSGSERSVAQSDSGRQHVHISQHGRVQTIQTKIPRDGERQVRVPVCQPLPSVPPQPVQHGSAPSGPGQARGPRV